MLVRLPDPAAGAGPEGDFTQTYLSKQGTHSEPCRPGLSSPFPSFSCGFFGSGRCAGLEHPRTASIWRALVMSAAASALVMSLPCRSETLSMKLSRAWQAPRTSLWATPRSASSIGSPRRLPSPRPFTDAASFCSSAIGLGGSAAVTVTVNVADTEPGVSSASVAVQVTVVVPTGKVEPEAWSQLTGGAVLSSSVAVGAV